jgi:uncharacterized protein YraI
MLNRIFYKRSAKFVMIALVLFLIFGFGGRAVELRAADDTWRARYWNNNSMSGDPVVDRQEKNINHDWEDGSPDPKVYSDGFSARWTRVLNFPAGTYRFTATMDDGMRIWLGDTKILDSWYDSQAHSQSITTHVPVGEHRVKVEYYENGGEAEAKLVIEPVSTDIVSWRGEYFNNKDLSGNPSLVRNDAHIAFNWGNGSPGPGINPDKFSVRWTRTLNLSPGQYRFTTVTDDGVRLWVNGQQIINAWHDNKPQENVGNIYLPGGSVEIRMEYYENAGGAQANLSRTLVSASPAGPTPTPQPTGPTATVVNARLNVREGPGTAFAILQVLGQGDRVTLLARNEWNTWAQVRTPNGLVGWVYAPLLQTSIPIANLPVAGGTGGSPNGSGPTATLSNAAYVLNVRSGPGTNFESIAKILRGQQVRMLGRNASSTWIKVQLEDGRQGWSSAAYLVSTTPFANLPVVSN